MNLVDQLKRDNYIIDRLEPEVHHAICMQYARTHMVDWQWFGWLWKKCHEDAEWWCSFGHHVVYDESDITHEKHQELVSDLEWFIDPDRFADAVYKFLKEHE